MIDNYTMSNNKTIRKKTRKPLKKNGSVPSKVKKQLSSTMQIPIESLLVEISMEKLSYLEIIYPNDERISVTLNKNEITIGRESALSVCLPFSNVSRKHAHIIFDGEEYIIEDLNSTNGTFINNVKISRCILRNNDQIIIGDTRIFFIQQTAKKT